MSDNLIKFDNTTIDEILRITPDGKLVSNHEALKPVIDRIEQLERELVVAIEVVAESGRKRGVAEAKLAKAVEALREIAKEYDKDLMVGRWSRAALAELEGGE